VDLVTYERAKFQLAAVLRSAQERLRSEHPNIQAPFTDLFARLAEDRFNLVVVGRFSRGKSSLMNALLDTERLPIGIVPVTSVITTVSYGSKERASVEFEGSQWPLEVTMGSLADYVTQQGNPGNRRRVALARIELPAELLRRGFHFVDTPGLGSAILENSKTTERFIPQADAFMLVTSFDSPLSHEELQTLRRVASSPTRIFLVVNKQDVVSAAERAEALAHVEGQLRQVFGDHVPKIFSVSAREALEATRQRDDVRYAESGVRQLRAAVTDFLLTQKQSNFLLRMCERAADALSEAPYSEEDFDRLHAVQQIVVQSHPEAGSRCQALDSSAASTTGFTACQVCERLDRGLFDFLCRYQWELTTRHAAQVELAEHYGLCAFHYWQFGSVASPQSICVGLSLLIDHWASHLRDVGTSVVGCRRNPDWPGLQPVSGTCKLCLVQVSMENSAVRELVKGLDRADCASTPPRTGLCLHHLEHVLRAIDSDHVARQLLHDQAAALGRLSEDMSRYASQRDGLRRALASEEDLSAERRALMVLGGHRNVFALRKTD